MTDQKPKTEVPKVAPTPAAQAPLPKKGMSRGGKIALGIIGGCLILLLIGGIVAFVLVKKAAKKVSQEIEKGLEQTDMQQWQKEWQGVSEKLGETFEETEKATEEKGKVGSTLSDNIVAITLSNVKKMDAIKETRPKEGYEFVDINVTLKNETEENITVYATDFILRDLRFTEYNQATLEEGDLSTPIKNIQDIPKGEKISGDIVFEVKKGVGALQLIYNGQKKLIFDIEQ
jgi:hypothetical protein